ncbi:MAG: purine-nucleoside phosphorylase [Myxococcales bacterium]|jgi:purine-nucleoside phosphorylase
MIDTTFETLERSRQGLLRAGFGRPRVAFVLGSGLGDLADTFAERRSVPYSEIQGIPRSAVEGHAGNLVFGQLSGTPAVAMQGRVHLYEGHDPAAVVFGVRLMVALGARVVVLTNAAGGIRDDLSPGTLMRIEDHLNLTGRNCLLGTNDERLGPRFPSMSGCYDAQLGELAGREASEQGLELPGGVYAGVLGPSYETPAEIRMLRTLGADAVGMSTVLETIAARHMGARCLGISCITNRAAGLKGAVLDHADVQRTAKRTAARFAALLRGLTPRLAAAIDEEAGDD